MPKLPWESTSPWWGTLIRETSAKSVLRSTKEQRRSNAVSLMSMESDIFCSLTCQSWQIVFLPQRLEKFLFCKTFWWKTLFVNSTILGIKFPWNLTEHLWLHVHGLFFGADVNQPSAQLMFVPGALHQLDPPHFTKTDINNSILKQCLSLKCHYVWFPCLESTKSPRRNFSRIVSRNGNYSRLGKRT
jgi:hypothetical protein